MLKSLFNIFGKKEELEEDKTRNVCAYPWQQIIIDLTGEVVPCCFWSGYGNFGKPLGNTNLNSIDEIWNNEAYRELRERNASGDLAGYPCYHCMSYRWSNGKYPPFSWPASFRNEDGYCYICEIPERFFEQIKEIKGPTILYEDGRELPFRNARLEGIRRKILGWFGRNNVGNALHDDIRRKGMGRYSVWGRYLYFSSSDNSNPVTSGRAYELRSAGLSQKLSGVVRNSLSGENLLLAHQEFIKGSHLMTAKPSMLSFISTSDCNIECPSCSQNSARYLKIQHRPETEPDVIAHIPYLYQLIWHGGEPFIVQRLKEFIDNYKYEDNPNLSFGFTSNGTLLNAAMLSKLDKFLRVNASISVDSFRKETYELIREGARFENVIENTLRAVSTYDAPDRVFVVGMIVLKSNILELPFNLRFAAEHDIGLNLSPVVVCPLHERLDIFQDFKAQTRGWKEAITESLALVKKGKAENIKAYHRVDPEFMIQELEHILQQAEQRYANTFEIKIIVSDPFGSLPKMQRPGIFFQFQDNSVNRLSYALFDSGPGEYSLFLPRNELTGAFNLNWYFCHDLGMEKEIIDMDYINDSTGQSMPDSGWKEMPGEIFLEIPQFRSVPRKSNAALSNRGLPTGEGLRIIDMTQLMEAHSARVELERSKGYGLVGDGTLIETIYKRQDLMRPGRYRNYKNI